MMLQDGKTPVDYHKKGSEIYKVLTLPLHYAAEKGKLEIVSLLIGKGANSSELDEVSIFNSIHMYILHYISSILI